MKFFQTYGLSPSIHIYTNTLKIRNFQLEYSRDHVDRKKVLKQTGVVHDTKSQ